MHALFRLLVLCSGLLLTSLALAVEPADFLYGDSVGDGSGLPFRYFVPPGYDAAESYPLILFLHGAGERGSDNEAQLANHANGAMYLLDDANLVEQPVFMLAPQCPSGGSWSGATLASAAESIEQLASEYSIDPDRIYITGLSLGGIGTWAAVTRWPQRFAAAVPMSGRGSQSAAPAVAQLPFWFFHAANDGTVAVEGSDTLVAALRDAGGRVIYTRYDTGGHAIWPRAYRSPLLFHWLISQHRAGVDLAVAPSVRITSPARRAIFTDAAAIELDGETNFAGETIDAVQWSLRGGGSGDADGSTSWTTGPIPLVFGRNLIRVQAAGPSDYAPWGGQITCNDGLRVTRAVDAIFADDFAAY